MQYRKNNTRLEKYKCCPEKKIVEFCNNNNHTKTKHNERIIQKRIFKEKIEKT